MKRSHGIAQILGSKVKEERLRRGISQIELATWANLSPNYISDIERGKRDVKISTVARIAEVLRVSPSSLL